MFADYCVAGRYITQIPRKDRTFVILQNVYRGNFRPKPTTKVQAAKQYHVDISVRHNTSANEALESLEKGDWVMVRGSMGNYYRADERGNRHPRLMLHGLFITKTMSKDKTAQDVKMNHWVMTGRLHWVGTHVQSKEYWNQDIVIQGERASYDRIRQDEYPIRLRSPQSQRAVQAMTEGDFVMAYGWIWSGMTEKGQRMQRLYAEGLSSVFETRLGSEDEWAQSELELRNQGA